MTEDSISVKMDEELKTKVRVAAAKVNEPMSQWVRQAILDKLEREGTIDEGNAKLSPAAMMTTSD